MTRDDIIRMSLEAGFFPDWNWDRTNWHAAGFSDSFERFAALVAAAEREACAKVADEWQLGVDDPRYQKSCADAIRARGQDPMPLFDDWGGIPYKSCPPCNQQCNQGRDCPNA